MQAEQTPMAASTSHPPPPPGRARRVAAVVAVGATLVVAAACVGTLRTEGAGPVRGFFFQKGVWGGGGGRACGR